MTIDRRDYLKDYRQKYKTRHKRVTVAFADTEYGDLEREAERLETTVTALVRERSLTLPSKALGGERALASKNELKEFKFLLRNVANNINQMAYHSNRLRQVLDEDEPLLELRRLEGLLLSFLGDSRR